MSTYTKPPLGVSPHGFVYRRRMQELNEAIGRYLDHIVRNGSCEYEAQKYEAIAGWAKEIEHLASLEANLERSRQ